MPNANGRSLKRFLIYPRFQLPLILINLSVILIFFVVSWVGTQNALLDLKPMAGLSEMQADFFRQYVVYQAANLEKVLLIALGVGLVGAGTATLIITHRLAGPLVRLRNFFSAIDGQKPVPPLEFRDGDFLRDLEPLVNTALKKIQKQD